MPGPGSVYLDHAATAPLDSRVAAAMAACLADPALQANPASAHAAGRAAGERVAAAREQVARLVNASPDAIVFTSGATESVNLAVLGAGRAAGRDHPHVVTSRIEHRAGLDACRQLEREGHTVTWLVPGRDGLIEAEQVDAALRKDTGLVTLMHANNETGALTDIGAVARLCEARGIAFHVDAAQSVGKLPVDASVPGIALLSFCAHKLGGPKGSGALYVRRRPRPAIQPLQFGGGHERGLRSGTLALHQLAGFGLACELAVEAMNEEPARIRAAARAPLAATAGGGAAVAKRSRRAIRSRNPERRFRGNRGREPVARAGRLGRSLERRRVQLGDRRAVLRIARARPIGRGDPGLVAPQSGAQHDSRGRRAGRRDRGARGLAAARGLAGRRSGADRVSAPGARYSATVRALFSALEGAGDLPPGAGAAV